MQRRFAIIGHRAPSSGKLNLNDLSGGSGRLDVLLRAVNSALFLSHGIRTDSHITLHLEGGPGPSRRIWFNGETLRGVRSDERSIAGQIKAILKRPPQPIGVFDQVTQGIFDTGGNISTTIADWKREDVSLYVLDAEGEPIENIEKSEKIGFILSDDLIFTDEEQKLMAHLPRISLGKKWLQGHSSITIVHHFLDQKE